MSRNWSGSALGSSAFPSTSKRSEPIHPGPPAIWNSRTRYARAMSIFTVIFLPPPWPWPTPAVTALSVLLGLIEATSNEGRFPARTWPNEGVPTTAIAKTDSVNKNPAWSANVDRNTLVTLEVNMSLKAVVTILSCGLKPWLAIRRLNALARNRQADKLAQRKLETVRQSDL